MRCLCFALGKFPKLASEGPIIGLLRNLKHLILKLRFWGPGGPFQDFAALAHLCVLLIGKSELEKLTVVIQLHGNTKVLDDDADDVIVTDDGVTKAVLMVALLPIGLLRHDIELELTGKSTTFKQDLEELLRVFRRALRPAPDRPGDLIAKASKRAALLEGTSYHAEYLANIDHLVYELTISFRGYCFSDSGRCAKAAADLRQYIDNSETKYSSLR